MKKRGETNPTYLEECLAFLPSSLMFFLMSVAQSVYILKNPSQQAYLSPDSLKNDRGNKRIYIFFCTEFFLKLYNFVNILLFCVLKLPAYRFQ